MLEDLCKIYEVNEEQARALDIHLNTALRAGAGSGKTRVLTKRFVRCLLENPTLTLDNIAAITFTRKAATEMKDRVRRELSDRISKIDNAVEKNRLSNIKMQITNSNIDTIHGFCGKILRDNFAFLGLDPDFNIMEEVDKSVLLSEIADSVIQSFIENEKNEVIVRSLAENFSTGFFTGKLKQGILSAFGAMREKGMDVVSFCQEFKTGGIENADPITVLESTALILINNLDNEYRAYKEKKNLLDFNDLEILSERLLRNNEIRTSYFSRFTTILVDEFQDVNPLQKKILDHLIWEQGKIPEGRLFIVGDHKQSIYGFRGSDYRVFEEACSEVLGCGKVEFLNNCYRSTKNIIGAVNSIFSQLLSPYEKLQYPGQRDSDGRKVELITWEKGLSKENKPKTRWDLAKNLLLSEDMKEELKCALEAEYEDIAVAGKKDYQGDVIAGVIQKLTAEDFLYRDIAILLRSRTSLSEIENSLTRNGIPYCVLGGIGFWDRQEIGDILSLYKLVFFPDDRLALFTVLRSPIFGFSDDMLLALSIFMRKQKIKNLDELLTAFGEMVAEDDKWVVKRAADVLASLLPMDGILNSLELMNKIIKATAYDEVLTALPKGEKKLRNIEKLIRIIEEFDAKGIYSARELLPYLDVLKESSGMDGEAFLDNEDSDAVKILTIHASKGLEFRAVLIPDMDRPLDSQAKRSKPLFFLDDQKGLIAMGLDESLKLNENANPEYAKLYAEKLRRELEDSRRLFYVAATRAKEYLGFIGEKQEVGSEEEIDAQNSFMKQLIWAMNKVGTVEEITSVDAMSLVPNQQKQSVYPPPFIAEIKKLTGINSIENAMNQRLEPCERHEEGNISISSWMKYRDCPRRFYLENLAGLHDKRDAQYTEGLPAAYERMNAADFGSLLHAFLEEVDILDLNKSGFKDNTSEVAAAIDIELPQADRELFEKEVAGFIKIEEKRRKENKGTLVTSLKEFGFRVPLAEGINLTGFIDRVDIFEREGQYIASIIDYKSNRLNNSHAAEEKASNYKEQLLSYAWALNQIPFYNGKKVIVEEALLYFLNNGEVVSIELRKEDIEGVVEALINSAPWLLGNKTLSEFQCCKSEKCSWCNCKKYCDDLN